ncbi:hypothetical protein BDA99DRAFT_565721 [Phascolomyces articulosus]|uniref:Uncharacterized protein n=1 Tax=Phascolomyces articulosus TaxID=60185 RepID=A0AAD5JXT4_9FUNG|nr:hypothetical protein BDA99DRAFT_565721 [Phascolomyces articulosus]
MVEVDINNGMTLLALSVLIVSALVIVSLILYCCCCNRHRRNITLDVEDQQHPDDRSPLLSSSFRTQYLKRTSTFYQWNRPAPPSPSSSSLSDHHHSQGKSTSHPNISQHQQMEDNDEDNEEQNTQQQSKRDSWISRRTELLKKYARSPSFTTTS